jgi:hypothetical protein
MSTGACRAFEERLLARLDLDSGPFPIDAHAAECSSCASLVEELLAESALFARMKRPQSPELIARLAATPPDFAARRAAAPVLELLEPGALAKPEPSRELMARLVFLPSRARRAARSRASERSGLAARLLAVFSDWRVTVAVAYAVTLVFVSVLKIDPMSVARTAAEDIGSAGGRAIAEAKDSAVKRIAGSQLAQAAAPLTSRFEYRLYRTMTAAKARASAYSQLVIEKVFGGTLEASGEGAGRPTSGEREPHEPSLRS